jgi:hypothetical protein
VIADEMIRDELAAAAASVPLLAPAPVQAVMRRGRRRRLVQRTALGAGAAALLIGAVATAAMLRSGGDLVAAPSTTAAATTTEASEDIPTTTAAAEETSTTTASEEPTTTSAQGADPLGLGIPELRVGPALAGFTNPPLYSALTGPPLAVDSTGFGEEYPFVSSGPSAGEVAALTGPSLYVGDVAGLGVFVGPGESGAGACLWVGSAPRTCDRVGILALDDGPPFAAWIGVPDGTAAIVLTRDGNAERWQAPRGGVAMMPVSDVTASVLMAVDEAGREIDRVELPLTTDVTTTTIIR